MSLLRTLNRRGVTRPKRALSRTLTSYPLQGFTVPFGGSVAEGTLTPDFNGQPCAPFQGNPPQSVLKAHYSAALQTEFLLLSGGVVARRKGEQFFTPRCDPLFPSFFFFEDFGNGEYRTVMLNATAGKFIYDDACVDFTPAVSLAMAVRHHGRIFGVDNADRFTLRWSGTGGMEDWAESITGAGYLQLDGNYGEIIALFSMGNKVVALREDGITCITAMGAPEHFKVSDWVLSVGKILPQTAVVCGDKLYFCTAAGAFAFDDGGLVRLQLPYFALIENFTCAAAAGQRLFWGVTCAFTGRQAVYCYRVDTKDGYFIDCAADCLIGGERITAFGAGEFALLRAGDLATAYCTGINFGVREGKTLTGITLQGNAQITVTAEGVSRTVACSGSGRVGLRGREFSLCVKAQGVVDNLTLLAEVLRGI